MNDTIMGRIGCRVKSNYEFDQPWRELTKGLEGILHRQSGGRNEKASTVWIWASAQWFRR